MSKLSSVCVYCGTGSQVDQAYKDAAHAVGQLLVKEGKRLIYGGGRVGLMGIVADSVFNSGGEVVGIIPEHIQDKEALNTDVTELHVVDSMHTRKSMMVEKSDAFIVLPGGFGTLDEAFEILTWKYLSLHDKPVVFVNTRGYWTPLLKMIDHMVAEGFTPQWQREMFEVVEDPSHALLAIKGQEEQMEPNIKRL